MTPAGFIFIRVLLFLFVVVLITFLSGSVLLLLVLKELVPGGTKQLCPCATPQFGQRVSFIAFATTTEPSLPLLERVTEALPYQRGKRENSNESAFVIFSPLLSASASLLLFVCQSKTDITYWCEQVVANVNPPTAIDVLIHAKLVASQKVITET